VDREGFSPGDLLHRAALEYFLRGGVGQEPGELSAQRIPVNVYETDEDVVIAAPMPGVEAENVDIEVVGSTVTLRSTLRGPGQSDRRYLLHEWTYGPYERTVSLPVEVDAKHANASHGNGILVVTLPKASRARSVHIPLRQQTAATANQRGHSGHHTTRQGLDEAPESR
jgi:HSP20 family protein